MNTKDLAIEIIQRLVEWQTYMGGFESPVWREAEAFLVTVKESKNAVQR